MINFNKEKLLNVINHFYEITHLNISVCDEFYNNICSANTYDNIAEPIFCNLLYKSPVAQKNCKKSDLDLFDECRKTKTACYKKCHAGLIDIASPIIFNEKIIGFIISGQILIKEKADLSLSETLNLTEKYNLNQSELTEAYKKIPVFSQKQLESIIFLANLMVSYILTENIVKFDETSLTFKISEYINKNFLKDINISDICREIHISKSTLYREFEESFNCTIYKYIRLRRLEFACNLLKNTDIPVSEIAISSGFKNAYIFCNNFKKEYGCTPLKYRKNNFKKAL